MKKESLVGIDLDYYARKVGEQLERDLPEQRAKAEEAANRYQYTGQAYDCTVRTFAGGYLAECVEPHPLVGRLEAVGRTPGHAVNELTFVLALKYEKAGLVENFDEARAAARKVRFIRREA